MNERFTAERLRKVKRQVKRNLLLILVFAALITPVQAAVSIYGNFTAQGTAATPKVLFHNGADNIATITGSGTGAQVNVTYMSQWNWTTTSALYVNNTDIIAHNVVITYVSSSGQMSELNAMYCYWNGTLFFSWYSGAAHTTTATWNNLAAGARLTISITTLGATSTVAGHTFTINFKVSY